MDAIVSLFAWFTSNGQNVVEAVSYFISGASILAAFTANKSDDNAIQRLLDVINVLAFNFGLAKNK